MNVLDTGDEDATIPWATFGYLQWHDRAARYYKAGQRQKICTRCCKWRWDDELCCDAPRHTAAEDRAETAKITRPIKAMHAKRRRAERADYLKALTEGRVMKQRTAE